MWWSSRWAEPIPNRSNVSKSKRSCTGQPSLSELVPKCTRSMKRAGLVFPCSDNLLPSGFIATWCPQKLDERNKRVKTDGLDAKALCLKSDCFVQGNREALAIVRVPSEEEERSRAIHGSASNWWGCASAWKLRGAV
jgi:hypothetical protein